MLAVERLVRTIGRQSCDRPPVIPQIFAHAAKVAGRSVDDYLASSATAAECQLAAWRHYGLESVFAVLDLAIEAEALGGTVVRRHGTYPTVTAPPFTPDRDFSRLALPDPITAGRMPAVVDMVARLRAGIGDAAALIGLVQGPMTGAAQLVGLERTLFLAVDETDRFVHLLNYATGIARTFGLAQLAAGADMVLVFEPTACPEIVPAGMFREMIGPRVAHLAAAFKRAGAKATWLHIAGQTAAILPLYSAFGIDIGNVDYCVDLDRVHDTMGESPLCLNGNIKPLSFVTDDADSIRHLADALLARFDGRGGFILSSGCEIPPEAEEANVAAMVAAARLWRSGQC
jgi:uroporphyrinogen decarboxylase